MQKFGFRIEDCARVLRLSISHAYKVARRPGFPRPIAIFGTIKIFDPKSVRTYAKTRKRRYWHTDGEPKSRLPECPGRQLGQSVCVLTH